MIGEATIGDFATTTGFSNIAGAILGKRVFVGESSCDSKWKNNMVMMLKLELVVL